MKIHFLSFLFGFAVALNAQAQTETAADTTQKNPNEISGVVRIIRANPETEVFFKELKDSYVIPSGSKHNQIYSACEASWKKGLPVKLVVNPVSRQILSLPDSKPAEVTAAGTEKSLEKSMAPGADGSK